MENMNIAEMSLDELIRLIADDTLKGDDLVQALDRIDMLGDKEKTAVDWELHARFLPGIIEKRKHNSRCSIIPLDFFTEKISIADDHFSGERRIYHFSMKDCCFHTYVDHWDGGNMFAGFTYGHVDLTISEMISIVKEKKDKTAIGLNEEERQRLEKAYKIIIDTLLSLCGEE